MIGIIYCSVMTKTPFLERSPLQREFYQSQQKLRLNLAGVQTAEDDEDTADEEDFESKASFALPMRS